MSKGLKYALTFTLGAAAGSAVSWFILKTRYEQIAQAEIDSVIEEFTNRKRIEEEEETDEYEDLRNHKFEDEEIFEYEDLAGAYNKESKKGGSDSMNMHGPCVVIPREFEENERGYDVISLNYYADGVLADDMDEIIEDVQGTVGDFKDCFGEYENDTVYVRNDRLKCYYEICADDRNYNEVADDPESLADED